MKIMYEFSLAEHIISKKLDFLGHQNNFKSSGLRKKCVGHKNPL